MKSFKGFEAAPKRRIWPALVAVADSLRLRRLFAEARRMMSTLRGARSSDQNAIQVADVEWSDLSRAVAAEEDKRVLDHAGTGEPGVRALSAAGSGQGGYVPEVGDVVSALGQQGVFEVTSVCAETHSVDLKLVDYEFSVDNIPWQALQLIRLGSDTIELASSTEAN